VEPEKIWQGQQKLERMAEVRRPAAKTNLLLATDGRDKRKLEEAIRSARLVGVEKRLIEKAERKLLDLGGQYVLTKGEVRTEHVITEEFKGSNTGRSAGSESPTRDRGDHS